MPTQYFKQILTAGSIIPPPLHTQKNLWCLEGGVIAANLGLVALGFNLGQ